MIEELTEQCFVKHMDRKKRRRASAKNAEAAKTGENDGLD